MAKKTTETTKSQPVETVTDATNLEATNPSPLEADQQPQAEPSNKPEAQGEDTGGGVVGEVGAAAELESKPQPMPAWRVDVKCTTPLARNPAVVHAFDQDQAWAAFCAMNGISGTDHPKTIEQVK